MPQWGSIAPDHTCDRGGTQRNLWSPVCADTYLHVRKTKTRFSEALIHFLLFGQTRLDIEIAVWVDHNLSNRGWLDF